MTFNVVSPLWPTLYVSLVRCCMFSSSYNKRLLTHTAPAHPGGGLRRQTGRQLLCVIVEGVLIGYRAQSTEHRALLSEISRVSMFWM